MHEEMEIDKPYIKIPIPVLKDGLLLAAKMQKQDYESLDTS